MPKLINSIFSDENIVFVEKLSSTKLFEEGNIATPIAYSKQTNEDITSKKDLKRRNADVSDINLSCKKR